MKTSATPPAIVLVVGALLATLGVRVQRSLPLREPLTAVISREMDGFQGRDLRLTPQEVEAAGVTAYLSRVFESADTTIAGPQWFQIYVGYYDRQASGKTIHSPKNCLPGGGWEPLTSSVAQIQTPDGVITVNRYLIQNGNNQALVLYWYQGRGRVAANEYRVKWDLLRDAALRRRSEEALVRIVVPVRDTEAGAFELASRTAGRLVRSVGTALPAA